MSFVGNFISSATAVADYRLIQAMTSSFNVSSTDEVVNMDRLFYTGSGTSMNGNNYLTNQNQVDENITLNVEAYIKP